MKAKKGNFAKSGQGSAGSAAVIIVLIAVMIILYILFLPPAERAALLGEDYNSGTGSGGGASSGKTLLLSKTPGRVFPAGSSIVEHKIPSFLVFTVTNSDELKRTDYLYIRHSAFGIQNAEMLFFYDEKTMADLKLSFNVAKHDGMLKIMLNGKEVFQGELDDGSPPPISIPKESLKSRNTLTFEASSPGISFWRVNEYNLESVVISGKVTDYTGASSEQHFSIADMEYEKLVKAQLDFLPDCPPNEAGQVQILLNARPVYTSFPDCGIKATIEISKEFLRPGDNTLVATTSTGSFLMDAPKLTTFMKEETQPVFYFTAPPNLIDALYAGKRGLMLTMRFADSSTIKRGTLEVNGFKAYFETQDYVYQTPMEVESVLEGSNGIKIIPLSGPLDITELRVDVI